MKALVIVLVRSAAAAPVVQLVLSKVILHIWFVCATVAIFKPFTLGCALFCNELLGRL
jgi:hypothetical protein